MIEDELLKLRFKAGRPDALPRIYEKYRDYLLTLAMAMLNDAAAAEDIVHDVFVSFAQSPNRFRLHGSLRAYLAACVANRVRDRMRARKHQGVRLDEQMPLESDLAPPDGRILSDERWRLVARALARLPEDQREVIALHLNGQLKLREIARLQNVPLTTVRGRYRHGIDRLMIRLKEAGPGEDLGTYEEEIVGRMFTFKRQRYFLSDGTEIILSIGEPKNAP